MSKKSKKNNVKKPSNTPFILLYSALGVVIVVLLILFAASLSAEKPNPKNPEETVEPQEITREAEKELIEQISNLDINTNPVVTIEMENGGIIKAELYPEIAPNTVCNFISLIKSNFYDGLTFHRCIKNFMIQGGDPKGDGTGGPGYFIKGEYTNNGFTNDLKHERGVLSMARNGMLPDSVGSQFFIMVADYTSIDGDYPAFGKVIEGMEVADEIVSHETDEKDKPLVDQVIKKITVETFGIEYPEPEKVG